MKKINRYIIIFIIVLFLLITILTIIAKIPTEKVERNLKQAMLYYKENLAEITMIKEDREYSYLHPYADEIILNIIKCLDTEKPLSSVLEARYYTRYKNDMSNLKYIELMANDYEGNTEYMRYWHGSIIFIKPLLILFTLEEIYIINAVILGILLIILISMLIKKGFLGIAISFIIAIIMSAIWYVPFTFEYIWNFYIMIIASIISIIIETKHSENKNEKIFKLFLIVGMLTCFFDFLTTEILTFLVPITMIFAMRMKKNEIKSLKEEIIFLIKCSIIWLIGYGGMWICKWILSSIVLNINAIDYVKENLLYRINGKVREFTKLELIFNAVKRNFLTLYPINLVKDKIIILLTIIVMCYICVLILQRRDKKEIKYIIILSLIAIVPYIRYIVLSQHSYMHSFFTFRSQIPTIMCYNLILINLIKKYIISIKNRKIGDINGK